MPVDAGALGGLVQGLQSGLAAYSQEKYRQRDLEAKGYMEDPETGRLMRTPEYLAEEKRKLDNEAQKTQATREFELKKLQEQRAYETERDTRKSDLDFNRQMKLKQMEMAGARSLEELKLKAKGGGLIGGGQQLKPTEVLKVTEGGQVARMLPDISNIIEANKDSFGPIIGRIGASNPYNEKAATIDAQMRASSQAFGRYMEGGVLRKEDEEKYRKMFPNLSDTPQIAKNKLATVQRLLADKQQADIDALATAGYNVSPFQRPDKMQAPSVLGLDKKIAGIKGPESMNGMIPKAGASIDYNKLSDADLEALWRAKQAKGR